MSNQSVFIDKSSFKIENKDLKELKYLIRKSNNPDILIKINEKYELSPIQEKDGNFYTTILSIKNNILESNQTCVLDNTNSGDSDSSPTSVLDNIISDSDSSPTCVLDNTNSDDSDSNLNYISKTNNKLVDQFIIDNDSDSDIELFRADELDITNNEINETVYMNPTFNIGVFGCLSSGKSTFINSLLGNKYAEMNMCRCTTCPQIYETKKNCYYTETDVIKIREEIEKINKEKSSLFEVTNIVPQIDIFNDFNNVEFKVYDIPGLNDCESSEIMYTYVENNFYKFDLIIFNIDITQGLGTKDEIKILETIQSMINNINHKYNRNVKLLIVCNKFDILDDDQLLCQYDQVQKQLIKYKIICPVIKYSSMYTHYYRYLSNTKIKLDDKTLKTLGENFMGMSWSLQTQNKSIDQKMDIIKKYIMDNSEGLLKLSGFDVLRIELQNIIKNNIYDLMYSKINYCTSIKKFKYKYNFIMKLNETFSHDYNSEMISKYLDQYLEYFEKRYSITDIQSSVDTNVTKRIDKIFNKLKKLDSIKLSDIDKLKINRYFTIYYNILADYEISKLVNNNIISGEICNILLQIQKTPYGMDKLKENINYLDKVPIDDFKPMIEQLFTFGFEHKLLVKLYSMRIINYYNTSEYSNMIKNYIVKKYHETHNEYFNYLSCHITSNTINDTFHYDKLVFDKLYVYLEEFYDFYSKE
jgi:GTPase Era involved in 16S rRNA processing